RIVRAFRAARGSGTHARPPRSAVRGQERDMSVLRLAIVMLAMLVMLAGCEKGKEPIFQGWVEAELIFVGPDETGRIETLLVRQGDHAARDTPLVAVEP